VNRELIWTPHDVEARYGEKRGKGSTAYKLHLTEMAGEDAPAIITDAAIETVSDWRRESIVARDADW
jgi:hypothetical protein